MQPEAMRRPGGLLADWSRENREIELKLQNLNQASANAHAIERGREVIKTEAEGLMCLADALNDHFAEACSVILAGRRQLVVTGMGKSGHIARKVAATFAATGTPAIYVHPGEAGHGDMGVLAPGDVLLVLSNSGNTGELRAIMNYARKLRIPVIGMASRVNSLVIELADVPLVSPQVREACSVNIAPTTSTAVQLALGDALAMTVMDMRGVSLPDVAALHPGGAIGLALAPVSELMHRAERLPLIDATAPMQQVITAITQGCFGVVGVVDAAGHLVGVITDGDLRRHFNILATAVAAQIMTRSPKVISVATLASEALQFLNENRITAAFVVEHPVLELQPPVGIIHIHDLLRQGLG